MTNPHKIPPILDFGPLVEHAEHWARSDEMLYCGTRWLIVVYNENDDVLGSFLYHIEDAAWMSFRQFAAGMVVTDPPIPRGRLTMYEIQTTLNNIATASEKRSMIATVTWLVDLPARHDNTIAHSVPPTPSARSNTMLEEAKTFRPQRPT